MLQTDNAAVTLCPFVLDLKSVGMFVVVKQMTVSRMMGGKEKQ